MVIGKSVRQDYDGDGSTALEFDADGDGVDDFEYASYGFSFVNQPSLGIDADNNLYCAFSANIDGAYESDTRAYRDVYLIKLDATQGEWKGPLNISEDSENEDVYPTIARDVYGTVHMVWQSDNLTGTAVQNGNGQGHDTYVTNSILYEGVNVDDIVDPASPVNTEPEIYLVDGTVPYALLNCPPPVDRFGQLYIFDYPDGDISDMAEATGTDVSVVNESEDPTENTNYWDLTATDSDGNTETVDYTDADGNYYPILVFDDTDAPVILLEPVGTFFSDEDGDGIEEEYVFEQEEFDTIDVLIDTEYMDYGAWLGGDEGFVFGCPPELSSIDNVDTSTPGTYEFTYEAVDINGNEAEPRTRVINVISEDTSAPTLEIYDIIDGQVYIVEEGYEYTAAVGADSWEIPGYYAYDNVDGDITSDVMIDGAVDLTTVGTYTLTFSVEDASGNPASQTVNVNVGDFDDPEIDLDGPATSAWACNTAFTDPGFEAFDEVDGDLTGSVTVTVQIEIDGETYDLDEPCVSCEGTYVITYEVCDAAGNCTSETRNVVVFDVAGTGACDWDCGACGLPGAIGINEVLANAIDVYPTPTTGILNISLDAIQGGADVYVMDAAGRTVAQQKDGQGTISVDLTDASAGVYLVKIVTAEGTITKKVVLDK